MRLPKYSGSFFKTLPGLHTTVTPRSDYCCAYKLALSCDTSHALVKLSPYKLTQRLEVLYSDILLSGGNLSYFVGAA